MSNPLHENNHEIIRLLRNVKSLEDFIAQVRHPDFDSFEYLHVNFSYNDTPGDVSSYVYERAEEGKVEFYSLLTLNSIHKVEAAMAIIEAQSALLLDSDSDEEDEIEPSLQADKKLMPVINDNAFANLAELKKYIMDTETIQEVYTSPLDDVFNRFSTLSRMGVNEESLGFSREELLQHIAENRIEFAAFDIESLHYKCSHAESMVDRAFYLRKSHDVGITPYVVAEDEILQKLDEASSILKECRDRVPHIMHFMSAVSQMGENRQSSAGFKAERYFPVPLSILSP